MEAVVPSEASAADTLLDKLQWRWVLLGGAVAFFGAAVARKKLRQRQKKQRTNQTVHRGIICGDCGDIIRGIRYMCANCTAALQFLHQIYSIPLIWSFSARMLIGIVVSLRGRCRL